MGFLNAKQENSEKIGATDVKLMSKDFNSGKSILNTNKKLIILRQYKGVSIIFFQ